MLLDVIISRGAVRMDLEYIDNWSLWLDFPPKADPLDKILFKTIPAVLRGMGV